MAVDEVLADNRPNFTSERYPELLAQRAIKQRRTQPYWPQTNGEAEPFIRTFADELLYARMFQSASDCRVRLARSGRDYSCHRHHAAVGGSSASRAHNLTRTGMRVTALGGAAPTGLSHPPPIVDRR